MRFVGFGVGDDTPDYSTFSRFRKRLLELGVFDELLEEINRQLEEKGLGDEGAKRGCGGCQFLLR